MESDSFSIIVLLLLSAFFSGSESAMFSLQWWHIHHLSASRSRTAQQLTAILARPHRLLITILLGNTLVNVGASALMENYFEQTIPDHGVWISIAIMTMLLLVFGEITPKTVAVYRPVQFSLLATWPVEAFARLLAPIRIVLEKSILKVTGQDGEPAARQSNVKKEEFLGLISEGVRREILLPDEYSVVESILCMDQMPVDRIMTPRTKIIALPEDVDYAGAVRIFSEYNIHRVPIYRGSIDRIVGILYAKDLFMQRFHLKKIPVPRDIARTPLFLPGCINLKQLYDQLKQRRVHIAIILDEYGGTAGLVSHQDVLQAILMPQNAEKKESAFVSPIGNNAFLVDCRIDPGDFFNTIQGNYSKGEFRTLNGYLLNVFGKVPKPGETIALPGLKITVVESGPRHIDKVKVERSIAEAPDD